MTPQPLPAHFEAAKMRDPRQQLAAALTKQGTSTAPVGHWTQGLARMLQAYAGKKTANDLNADFAQQGNAYSSALANALTADNPVTALSGATDPTLQAMALELRLKDRQSALAYERELDAPMTIDTPNGTVVTSRRHLGGMLTGDGGMDFGADATGATDYGFETPAAGYGDTGQTGGIDAYVDRVVDVESAGNPNARNPRSSAYGLGQFVDDTWMDVIQRHGRGFIQPGMTEADILDLRRDPEISRAMTEAYARDNATTLERIGLPVTPDTLYMAHFLGPGGARAVMTADPSTPFTADLYDGADDAMESNPTILPGRTVGEIRQWVARKMRGDAPALAAEPAQARQRVQRTPYGVLLGGPKQTERERLAQAAGLEPGTQEYQDFLLGRSEPDPTSAQREYEMARQQGYEGTFMDYKRDLAEAQRAQTTVNVGSEEKAGEFFGKELGKQAAGRMNSMYDTANRARKNLATAGEMERAFRTVLDQGGTIGPGADLEVTASRVLRVMGINPADLGLPEDTGAAETLQALAGELVLGKIGGENGMPANNFSDADRKFIENTVPQLDSTPSGFLWKLEIHKRLQQRALERETMWNQAIDRAQAEGIDEYDAWRRFERDWADYVNQTPLIDDDTRQQIEGAMSATTTPSGAPNIDALLDQYAPEN